MGKHPLVFDGIRNDVLAEIRAVVLKGFDENIIEASQLLSLDENAKEYIQTIGHFIVDEAQDMTGIRASIVLEVISNLQVNCGVSVFSDDAQAIYGFSEEGKAEFFGNTLPEEIRTSEIQNKKFDSSYT